MTSPDQQVLLSRARRAYELGRLQHAARVVPAVLLLTAVALGGCASESQVCITSAVLLVGLTALHWRGGAAGRAVFPGMLAGVAPLLVPKVLLLLGHGCAVEACARLCVPVCLAAGLLGGAWLSWWAWQRSDVQRIGVLWAAAVALLVGSLGCLPLGLGGLVGVSAGVLVALTPVWTRHAPSAA